MLMFSSGILATFIPELIMVIGFVMCLVNPNFNTKQQTLELNSVVVQVTANQHSQLSTYQLTVQDFQVIIDSSVASKPLNPTFVERVFNFGYKFSTSDSFKFFYFSRPPPTFLS